MHKKTITGTVISSEDQMTLPGVSVVVKGTTIGTITDIDGKYTIDVPEDATALLFTYVGMVTEEFEIGANTVIDVQLVPDIMGIDEVVVTALGISRDKKSLGYAVQEISGDEVSAVKTDNVVNSLSGKFAGVQVKRTNNMGGSSNILIRGSTSLTGDNQALFVVDGIPISNRNTNSRSQEQTGTGYDYGNAASDINPDDIESVTVLKGAAATALYGSRAANGVIMVTTKKGKKGKGQGLGITVSSGFSYGVVDKSTFAEYQDEYGAGYGPYYGSTQPGDPGPGYIDYYDFDGDGADDYVALFTEDGSYGHRFDADMMVYQWHSLDPASPHFMEKTPWKAAKNGPITFFENPISFSNSVSIEGGGEKSAFRLSYTNYNEKGLLPNSELKRNTFTVNGSYDFTDKLSGNASANFVKGEALGRNSTGYSDNLIGANRQWWQTNVDLQELKDVYDKTGRNVTWNPRGAGGFGNNDLLPIYWDNPYWTRYENYQNDNRNRLFGNMALSYKINDWLDVMGRISMDTYNELQEERRAVGSVANRFGIGTGYDGSLSRSEIGSGYLRRDIISSEYNYDAMINFNRDLTSFLHLKGVVGMNIMRQKYEMIFAATNGGLLIPELYSLKNSADPLALPVEHYEPRGVNGLYGSASLGYNKMVFLDVTLRRDVASTLPEDNNTYIYPSVATSFIFSEVINNEILSFGKIRLNYAEVGNYARFDQLSDAYDVNPAFGGLMTSVPQRKKNPDLKPERTKSMEAGVEMYFLNRRVGLDFAYYKTNSVDQIMAVPISTATGYSQKVVNAGEIENKGIEIALTGVPLKTNDFEWDIVFNFAKNTNEVVSLEEGIETLQLGSYQGGVTINAVEGEPYGVIYGTDYTYLDGKKIVDPDNGEYIKTDAANKVIGNINPDWTAGLRNTLTYKDISLSFLIDIQQGGSIFSLDMYYGLATGLYPETVGTNDLGNPYRNPLAYVNDDPAQGYDESTCGGFINSGVNADGSKNETRIDASRYGAWGYRRGLPDIAFVYDASYIKLRELSVSYKIPLKDMFIKNAIVSFVGSNLWIISKDLPYADPESGMGAGNMQGYSTGSLPTTRNFAFNLKLQF